MTVALRPAVLARAPRIGFPPRAELAVWVALLAVVAAYLSNGDPQTGHRLLVGNVVLEIALVYGLVRCVLAARRPTASRRAWTLICVALGFAVVGQALFAGALVRGATPSPSPVTDLVSYLGYSLPMLVALFWFPRPTERVLSRLREGLDALVITTGVLLVGESSVLAVLRRSLDVASVAAVANLAYPVADIALCAVVLTLGMRQAPGARAAWLCLGTGLVALAVTDGVYVRLLAEGRTGLTGGPLMVGWILVPVLIGLATRISTSSRPRRLRQLDLVAQLVPYVPVLSAGIVLVVRPIRSDPLVLVGGVVLAVAVTVRQVMIVWENLSLTRGLEQKVAERTAELATLVSIVTSSRDAVVGFGLDRTITAWNPAAEELFSHRASDVLGREVSVLAPRGYGLLDDLLLSAARGQELESFEIEWTRPDGSSVPVSLTFSPVVDDGVVTGVSFSAQDITERRRAAAVLEQAREDALASARAKSEFLATMSHEIRTPMNGVIGLVSLLMDTDLDPQQRSYAEGVGSAGQALLDVINDILDFSKLEAGKVLLDTVDVDLRTLAQEVGDLLAPAAYAKGLELLVDVDPRTVALVRGDPVRLKQVLLNLASNAVKFTAQGEVQLKVAAPPSATGRPGVPHLAEVRVEVVDTGIGIAADVQDRLFESFSQADASTTRRFGGTGLGLAICRRLMEAMGGEVGVVSAPGAGSTFWFTVALPVAAVDPGRATAERVPDLPPRLRVLVVDDNATNRTILTAQLESWGARVDTADGAAGALEALRTARETLRAYDLAVLDMVMPEVDGLELARRVAAEPGLDDVPMIMLSSAPRVPQPVIDEAGIGTWLSKPVRAEELRHAVAALVGPARGRPQPDAAARPSGSETAEDARPASRGRVLVAEDNELNQLVARGLLERLGFEVDVAGDGLEALAALERTPYAVVLMDCHMPNLDGYAATARIREREAGWATSTPVVALTASATVADREHCLAAGMDDHLAKPIDCETLAEILDRWVPVELADRPVPRVARAARDGAEPAGPIDTGQLAELAELRTPEGTSLLAGFVSSFAGRAENRLDAIRDCLRRRDDEALALAAHELKGSAATIGAVRVAALCAELEHGGVAVLERRPSVLDELADELETAVDELDLLAGRMVAAA